MVACTEGHQVGIVGGGWVGHAAGTADVGVAQLVRQALQLVSCELVVVPQHVVVGGAAGALGEKLWLWVCNRQSVCMFTWTPA